MLSAWMGHAKELITMDVYGDNQNIIPEEMPELTSYMEDVLPTKIGESGMELEVLDTVMEVNYYLQQLKDDERDRTDVPVVYIQNKVCMLQ